MARRALLGLLVAGLVALQAHLWLGDGGIRDVLRLREAVAEQRAENQRLVERNQALAADVTDLKTGLDAVEERARRELGMVREGETFFQVTAKRDAN